MRRPHVDLRSWSLIIISRNSRDQMPLGHRSVPGRARSRSPRGSSKSPVWMPQLAKRENHHNIRGSVRGYLRLDRCQPSGRASCLPTPGGVVLLGKKLTDQMFATATTPMCRGWTAQTPRNSNQPTADAIRLRVLGDLRSVDSTAFMKPCGTSGLRVTPSSAQKRRTKNEPRLAVPIVVTVYDHKQIQK